MKKTIAICTPSYTGTVHHSHVPAVAVLDNSFNADWHVSNYVVTAGIALLDHARNCCADSAMATGADWTLWIDADTVLEHTTLVRLCDRALAVEIESNAAFLLSAATPLRLTHDGQVWERDNGVATTTAFGVREVEHVGMACTLMTRTALEAVRQFGHNYTINGNTIHESFSHGASRDGTYVGEDVRFCRTLRAAGGRVYLDPNIKTGHFSPVVHREEAP